MVWELRLGSKVIQTTAEHPFYREGKWISTNQLKVGDRLLCEDGSTVNVEGIHDTGEWQTVYNFRVADHHTYFVGHSEWGWSVWSHNSYADELADIAIKGWKKGKGSAQSHAEHALEMGFKNTAEYTNAAKSFAKDRFSESITAKIGNTFFKFDHSTGRILIVNGKDRVIKTFYTADDGIKSLKNAMQQHIQVLRNQGAL